MEIAEEPAQFSITAFLIPGIQRVNYQSTELINDDKTSCLCFIFQRQILYIFEGFL